VIDLEPTFASSTAAEAAELKPAKVATLMAAMSHVFLIFIPMVLSIIGKNALL
jgi:hypothetical protein